MNLAVSEHGPVAGSCEQGKLTSGVHKSGNFVVVLFLPAE
jgi:hypothetical protein